MGLSLRHQATAVVRRLQDAGFAAFWVGGCVRDKLLGREPDDYDIATAALPEQIEALFPHTVAVGRKFGVVIVVESDRQFQVATFRAEADYQDGRHPQRVTFGDARADASRRDFTVNGLFHDPVRDELHDWVGGGADLSARLIRTIGSPADRFAEDHLRLLRAARLAAQLGFDIEPGTFAALRAAAPRIQSISAERIRDELLKLFAPAPPVARDPGHAPAARGLDLLNESGLLHEILPELEATLRCEQSPDYHPEGNVFNHVRLMLSHVPADADPLLPWAVLLHDIAKPATASREPGTGRIHFYEHEKVGADMAESILKRLRFPGKQIETLCAAVRHHMQFKDAAHMRTATLRRMLLRPTFALELELHRLDCLGSHGRLDIHAFLAGQAQALEQQPQLRPPLLTGDDLIALGVKPGPALGALLAELRERQLQGELASHAEALEWVRRGMAAPPSDAPPQPNPTTSTAEMRRRGDVEESGHR
jgi:poly(A) polymerase